MSQRRPSPWIGRAIATAAVLVVLGVVWWVAQTMLAKKVTAQRPQAQQITMIRPTPPPPEETPPPPPPPEEKIEEQLPQDTPDPSPSPDNSPEQLGLDADASAGGDAFGLAARRGGTDLVGTGTAIFGRYTSRLATAVKDCLSDDEQLRKKGSYSAAVRVWVDAAGHIERIAIWQGTGKAEVDQLIQQSKSCRAARVSEGGPPLEMPQPINLKIDSRG